MNREARTTNDTALDGFDSRQRQARLRALAGDLIRQRIPTGGNVNMHAHSFYSFHAEGWSPSRVAWECRRAGLYAAGLCDFDVLDGVEEFLDAGLVLGLRVAAHLETRVFVDAWRDLEITSPGEPGVTYIMGAGFVRVPPPATPEGQGLAGYRTRAAERNRALVARINARLSDVAVDLARDVDPLTPAGNATERHLIRAYIHRARAVFGESPALAAYWGEVLAKPAETVAALMADAPRFEEDLRARLVKRGGLAYEQPSDATFPPVAAFTAWVRDCGAIPMITWLDGTSAAEQDAAALLDALMAQGCQALNIVPDRNWNVPDPADRARKVENLRTIVREAERRHLPINIGTEMNRLGLPFVDDLNGEVLGAFRDVFQRGARVMVGHSLLARYADYAYSGAAAAADFPEAAARNAFFERVGGLPPFGAPDAERLRAAGPERALAWFRGQAAGR